MRAGRCVRSSLRALAAQKTRTVLALTSVAIGVAAVFVTSAVARGAQREMLRGMEALGTNILVVKPAPVNRTVARKEIRGLATSLTLDDYHALAELPVVSEAAPAVEGGMRVKAGGQAMTTTVRGTTSTFLRVRRFRVRAGRFFDADGEANLRVAVLGARVEENLFPEHDAVGGTLWIRGVPFEIVGTLEAKGVLADGDEDSQVLVPIETARRRVFNLTWLSTVYVSLGDAADRSNAIDEMGRLLRERHRVAVRGRPDDFVIQDPTKFLDGQRATAATLARAAVSLASVATLVGGAGILALMLLSVKARTSEIGLRVAIGARRRDIVVQFLIEATALAVGGWMAGTMLGGVLTTSIAAATRWRIVVPFDAVVASFAMAVTAGLGFGALPARRAAGVRPIEALLVKS